MTSQNELANNIIGTFATGSRYWTNQGAALERCCINKRAFRRMLTSADHVGEDCFGVKSSRKIILGIMNSTDRRGEKRNFLIQGKRFRRSFKNYCNYRYFMKLSRLLSIVKLGIDVLLSEHLQSRCIDSSMYRYTPTLRRHFPLRKRFRDLDRPTPFD